MLFSSREVFGRKLATANLVLGWLGGTVGGYCGGVLWGGNGAWGWLAEGREVLEFEKVEGCVGVTLVVDPSVKNRDFVLLSMTT